MSISRVSARFQSGLWFIIASGVFFSLLSCQKKEDLGRSFVIVVDTSGSMIEGKESTMDDVKRSFPRLMEAIRPGDTVSLMQFADSPEILETFQIKTPEDKKAVTRAVYQLVPDGRYTDMGAMLVELRDLAKSLQKEGEDQFLIVLSDGLDDPPPGKRKEKVELDQYRSERGGPVLEPYIYYVSLGESADPALQKGLDEMSSRVKVVEKEQTTAQGNEAQGEVESGSAGSLDGKSRSGEGSEGTAEGENKGDPTGLAAVAGDIKEVSKPWYEKVFESFAFKIFLYFLLFLLLLLLLYLLFLFLRWMFRGPFPYGKLYYYEEGRKGLKNEFNLGKVKKDRVVIGSSTGVNLKIKDLGIPGKVVLKTRKSRGEIALKPQGKSSQLINFVDREASSVIKNGDSFKIGNYIFEYGNAQKKSK